VLAGVLLHPLGTRWVWAGGAVCFAIGAVVALFLTRPEQGALHVEPQVVQALE
jgi:hypothetical protein